MRLNLRKFFKASASYDNEGGSKTSYSIILSDSPKSTISPLSAIIMQRCIDEMANDVGTTLASELQYCKFSIQLKPTFGSSNILMS